MTKPQILPYPADLSKFRCPRLRIALVSRASRGSIIITGFVRIRLALEAVSLPNTIKLLLILLASSNVLPALIVFLVNSLPAKSTKLILPCFDKNTPPSVCCSDTICTSTLKRFSTKKLPDFLDQRTANGLRAEPGFNKSIT
uniref:Uncharacterized protein n=1 Tax=Glossina brevipalpis TaxID=37001 RepID=A0A1A9W8D2_9MUSC